MYQSSWYHGDYFVVSGLKRFLNCAIANHVKKHSTVLDVGCGEQPLRTIIERRGGVYVGVDIEQNSSGSLSLVASATNLPVHDESYDVIICSEVLEHVHMPGQVLRELARVVKPAGHLIITTPFAYPLHEEPYDYNRLTNHQMQLYARENGLEIVVLEMTGNEIEVMATVWSNIFTRTRLLGYHFVFQRIWRKLSVGFVMIGNLAALVATVTVGRLLPQKYYLNTCSVLQKQPAAFPARYV
jgi:ubiquinone/menaquinone biosynthesis C-methylase UbiE